MKFPFIRLVTHERAWADWKAQTLEREAELKSTLQQLKRAYMERDVAQAAAGFLGNLAAEPPTDAQILGTLGLAHDETPWWRAIMHLLSAQSAQEIENALMPDLASEASHYNRGRAAALLDLREMLFQEREKASRPPEERQ